MSNMLLLLLAVLLLTAAGCREKAPSVKIDAKSADGIVQSEPEVIRQITETVKVVSGEDARVADDDESAEKDETGAVAVQAQF